MYVMGDGPQVRQNNSTEHSERVCTARICHTRVALPAAAGRDRDAGCSVLFALLLLFVVCGCIWVLCRTKQNRNNSREIIGTSICGG